MYNHTPPSYICPICLGVQGVENSQTLIRQSDILFQDDAVTAFIASYFIGKNDGHVIVVPNEHFENMFDLPDEVGAHVFSVAKKMAAAMMEAYGCGGVTTLQNNGPDAGQHAFHYHLHLFPRYENDGIYTHMNSKRETTAEERLVFAEKMKAQLGVL